jgi:hypothetical protein
MLSSQSDHGMNFVHCPELFCIFIFSEISTKSKSVLGEKNYG